MKKITTADRLRYWFDNLMAKGTPAMIGMLFVASALLIILISAIVSLTPIGLQEDGTRLGFVQVAWMSLMRTLDAGTMGGDDNASPIINLQTNFGGGKTHTMLAVYHLATRHCALGARRT